MAGRSSLGIAKWLEEAIGGFRRTQSTKGPKKYNFAR
jgi:hypothetical protein